MKLRNLFIVLFAAIFAFSACEDDSDNPIIPTEKPQPPTNLQATSKSATSVLLRWTPSTSETNTDFDKYVLTITGGTNPIAPFEFPAGTASVEVSGLDEGTIYTFSISTRFYDGTLSETSAQIQWSPATRFTRNQNNEPIRIYETDSDFGSGLVIYDPVGEGPKNATVVNGAQWNLGLDTRNGVLKLASARLLEYNWGTEPVIITEIANDYYFADNLDDVFDSQALDAKNFAERSIDLSVLNSNFVIVVRYKQPGNNSYNYAKILVKYNNGTFLQGTPDNRYVEFEISYQMVPGVPYAKTPAISEDIKVITK